MHGGKPYPGRCHFPQSPLTISWFHVNRFHGVLHHDNVETGLTSIKRRRADAVVGGQSGSAVPSPSSSTNRGSARCVPGAGGCGGKRRHRAGIRSCRLTRPRPTSHCVRSSLDIRPLTRQLFQVFHGCLFDIGAAQMQISLYLRDFPVGAYQHAESPQEAVAQHMQQRATWSTFGGAACTPSPVAVLRAHDRSLQVSR